MEFKKKKRKNTDQSIWYSIINGDEAAFSELFEAYYNLLFNYAYSLTSDRSFAKDCIQDVFSDLWLYKKRLNSDINVKAYLLAAVRNRIKRKKVRDKIFQKSTSLDELDFTIDFTIENKIISEETELRLAKVLNEELNNLSPRQKEIIYLKYYLRLNTSQISDLLEINYQSVNNLLHRTILALRKRWKGGSSF